MTRGKKRKKLFQGKKVYFSAPIRGARENMPGLAKDLVEFMKKGGANVLSEHVVADMGEMMDQVFSEKAGISFSKSKKPWVIARQIDFQWVDKANYLVAEVTSPSIGVGMEIQRAKDKEKLGLDHTKILCLCRQEVMDKEKLSWMIKGITPEEHRNFYLKGYRTLPGAKRVITRFLTHKLKR
jgi:hypothetical protein